MATAQAARASWRRWVAAADSGEDRTLDLRLVGREANSVPRLHGCGLPFARTAHPRKGRLHRRSRPVLASTVSHLAVRVSVAYTENPALAGLSKSGRRDSNRDL